MDDVNELRPGADAPDERDLRPTRALRSSVRRRSRATLWGLRLYDVAVGPDPETGELRGHARGILAIGDIATGVLAIGGLARGFVAVGGVAGGFVAIGGAAIGVVSLGGLAIGLFFAVGGLAIGLVAVGGLAIGYYATGGSALGTYVITATWQDPEAVRFFGHWSWLLRALRGG